MSDIIQSEERKLCRPPLRAERAFMDRGAWILIMVLFIAVLVGSYWFLLAPAGQGEEQETSSPSHRGRGLFSGLRSLSERRKREHAVR